MISYKKISLLVLALMLLITGIYFGVRLLNVHKHSTVYSLELIEPSDTKILKNGEIFIASTRAVCGAALMELVLDEKDNKIFFYDAMPGLDFSSRNIFAVNTRDKSCAKLNSGSVLNGFFARQISADQTRLAVIPENDNGIDRQLTVIDLLKDKVIKTFNLADVETFNYGSGIMDSRYEISWLGEDKIQANVYDLGSKKLIETRIFVLD